MTDDERFKDAAPFMVRCRACKGEVRFEPLHNYKVAFTQFATIPILSVFAQESIVTREGVKCPACQAKFGIASLQAQLEVQIREKIAQYYQAWTVCDDTTCGNRTRMMGVYGRRCLRPGCRGTVAFEVSFFLSTSLARPGSSYNPVFRYCTLQPTAILFIPIRWGQGCESGDRDIIHRYVATP